MNKNPSYEDLELRCEELEKRLASSLKTEEDLQFSEERFAAFMEHLPAAVFIRNAENRYLYVNRFYEDIFGPRKGFIGKTLVDVYPQEIAEAMIQDDKKVLLKGHSLTEDTYLDQSGEERVYQTHKFLMKRKDGSKLIGGFALDITERKKAEEALRKSQATLERVFQAVPVGLGLVEDRVMQWHNKAMTHILGYALEDLRGKSARMLYTDEEEFRRVGQVINQSRLDRETAEVETPWIRKDGSTVDCLVRYTLLDPEAKGSAILAMVEDISFQKRAEEEKKKLQAQLQQAQKMEAVGTLAGGVAHDFNNLLQAILGYTQMLLMDMAGSEAEISKLKQIEKSAQRASELTQQLLTFSRKVESKLRPIDLNQEVSQVGKLLERTIPKMIEIDVHLQDGLWNINGDPAQIEQIMMNLGVNARDAMLEGGKLVFETGNGVLDAEYCHTHLGAMPGRYVLLSISDTGVGMDRITVEHIFEPFYTTKEVGKGTGLGLAMVYGIVKNHGGYIMCYSEPGEGTTFKIYFPALETESVKAEEDSAEEDLKGGNETILLVDDEKSLRDSGKELLERFGYRIITAADGETALETWKEKGADIALVILDLVMPGMGGKLCLEALLQMEPGLKVIIASGHTVSCHTKEVLDAGAKGFIRKPYELKQMLKEIREVLES